MPVNCVMPVHTILHPSLHNLSIWQYNELWSSHQDLASNYSKTMQENWPSNCTVHADCTGQCGDRSPPIQQHQTKTDSNVMYSHFSKNMTAIMSASLNNNCFIWIILLCYVITPHQIYEHGHLLHCKQFQPTSHFLKHSTAYRNSHVYAQSHWTTAALQSANAV